ncbi:hypothetical protein BC936DRAFT_148196 [Jimgerdemannia flammicorona]|uniref:RNA helicase aquarius N-terminal domain-containing protein n=1 Tax=Jimgerdemannia flammicorona TaxID=994334 RepID=A0A433DN91_9FUNG|nr:hypothetical protein BC936DRAFT_148196 [Jimgerdemannia flammicorona]
MDRKSTLPLHANSTESSRGVQYPTLAEIQADSVSIVAEKLWSNKEGHVSWDFGIVKSIYRDELVKTNFNIRKIMLLEFSQYLEKYLWPNFNETDASSVYVLSIVLMINEKFRQRVSPWGMSFVVCLRCYRTRSIIFVFLTNSVSLLNINRCVYVQSHQILWVFHARPTHYGFAACGRSDFGRVNFARTPIFVGVYDQCVPEFGEPHRSIGMHEKMWNAIEKKFEGSGTSDFVFYHNYPLYQATRKKMEFERSWLSVMLKEFIKILYTIPESEDGNIRILTHLLAAINRTSPHRLDPLLRTFSGIPHRPRGTAADTATFQYAFR